MVRNSHPVFAFAIHTITTMIPLQLFDPASSTYTYLLHDPVTREALLIDPVDAQLERDLAVLQAHGLTLRWTLETHTHADHITSAGLLAEHTGARTAAPADCGIGTAAVQLQHGDTLDFGSEQLRALHTPGHTAGSMSYLWRSHVFTGDALLINGCGRTDFQSGDAHALYRSLTEVLFALPDDTTVWPGHDYHGRSHSSIGAEKAGNARVAGLFCANAGVAAAVVVVPWPDGGVVGQRKQHFGQAAVKRVCVARLEVGAAAAVDEQRVAGKHMAAPQVRHAARRVAWCVQRAQLLTAKVQRVAVLELHGSGTDATVGRRRGARARVLGQQAGAGDVVGVGVRFQRPAQRQAVRLQNRQVAFQLRIHRVDEQRFARDRVVQQIGVGAGGRVEELQGNHGGDGVNGKGKNRVRIANHCGQCTRPVKRASAEDSRTKAQRSGRWATATAACQLRRRWSPSQPSPSSGRIETST